MLPKVLIDYIRQYVHLSDEDISVISKNASHRKYLKGQYIVQQGDICKYESFVIRGCLKTFHIDEEGQEHIVRFAIENWWTADMGSFIAKTPADYNVQCLEDTEVIQFTYDALEQIAEEVPQIERFFRIIIQKAFVASERRIIRNYSQKAINRYEDFRKKYPEIEQRVPQYMIASYLGITKEFLSKVRNNLAHHPVS